MSQDAIFLAQAVRLASEKRSRSIGNVPVDEHYQHVVATELGVVPRLVPRYMAAAGGSVEMDVNGSVTPLTFDLAPAADEIWRVARLVLQIVAPTAAAPDQFGSLAALANGLLLELRDAAGVLVDLTAGQPIKANRDLALGWSTSIADTIVGAEWLFAGPIRIEGGLGEFLRLTVRDDLSTLTRMRVLAEILEETSLT